MSASVLRSGLRERLRKAAEEVTQLLTRQHDAPLDVMRLRQGELHGLAMAGEFLDEEYKDLHG